MLKASMNHPDMRFEVVNNRQQGCGKRRTESDAISLVKMLRAVSPDGEPYWIREVREDGLRMVAVDGGAKQETIE